MQMQGKQPGQSIVIRKTQLDQQQQQQQQQQAASTEAVVASDVTAVAAVTSDFSPQVNTVDTLHMGWSHIGLQ